MLSLPEVRSPLVALGMTSFVLGVIGLMLFFMPVLGIPISVLGLCFGIVGLLEVFVAIQSSLRWSLYGTGFCALALAVNIAIAYAPSGYMPGRAPPAPWEPPPGRPYVPPVANPVMK